MTAGVKVNAKLTFQLIHSVEADQKLAEGN